MNTEPLKCLKMGLFLPRQNYPAFDYFAIIFQIRRVYRHLSREFVSIITGYFSHEKIMSHSKLIPLD
jgi:hypothetical protein